MGQCPKCHNEYGASMQRCPLDGVVLVATVGATAVAHAVRGPTPSEYSDDSTEVDKSPSRGAAELQKGTRVGEYEVDEKIGEGGMGLVYAGHHPVIGKKVAIKVLRWWFSQSQPMVGRFLREAKAVNAIAHENIVDIFAFGELPDGQLYLVMEFLKGQSLKDRLLQVAGNATARQSFILDEAFLILIQVCDALLAAHATGIVHRDLKPDNIFLTLGKTGRRTTKLLDFGIAKQLGNESVGQTATGTPMGTPLYMSPEQCRGQEVDHRTDIYSLGVIMYELFCGQLPFPGQNFIDVVNGHLSTPPPRGAAFAKVHPRLQTLILQCLEKNPEARPPLADVMEILTEVAMELDADLWQSSGSMRLTPQLSRLSRNDLTRKSYAGWYIGTGAISALVAVATTIALHRSPPPKLSVGVANPATAVVVRGGTVRLRSNVAATFTLDGNTVAEHTKSIDVPDVAPGVHQFGAQANGMLGVTRAATVTGPGAVDTVEIELLPAPAAKK